jgi:hypothetical protein
VLQLQAARRAQALLFAEVARRTQAPFDALPADASHVLAALWREAAIWALAASSPSPHVTLEAAAAMHAADREIVTRAAGGSEGLAGIDYALASPPPAAGLAMDFVQERRKVELLANFTRALLAELEAPVRERKRDLETRLMRVAVPIALSLVLLSAAVYWFVTPVDRAASANVTISSKFRACVEPHDCGNAFFHTLEENKPWIMYDLKAAYDLHQVQVVNRTDCCWERAVPLVLETSADAQQWSEQARIERAFVAWSPRVHTHARYVRLRVDRLSALHLNKVVIH